MLSLRTSVESQRGLNIQMIAAGHDFSLFVTAVGGVQRLHGMGCNSSGQLAQGPNRNEQSLVVLQWYQNDKPVEMRLTDNQVSQLVAGGYHALMLMQDGTVWGCGANGTGQLGMGVMADNVSYVRRLTGFHEPVVKETMPVRALNEDDEAYFQRLDAFTVRSQKQVVKPVEYKVAAIAAGECHSLFLMENGKVFGCGVNMHGQLADLATRQYSVGEIKGFPEDAEIVQMSAGDLHSLFLSRDGRVFTCGDVFCPPRKFEDDKHALRSICEVKGLPTDVKVKQISAGHQFNTALLEDGRVLQWSVGANKTAPQEVQFPQGVRIAEVKAGGNKVSYLTTDNRVFVAGFNGNGELGLGKTKDYLDTPVELTGFTQGVEITQMAHGHDFSLYCLNDQTIQSCGHNRSGQQGRPSQGSLTSKLHHPQEVVEHKFERAFTVFAVTRQGGQAKETEARKLKKK